MTHACVKYFGTHYFTQQTKLLEVELVRAILVRLDANVHALWQEAYKEYNVNSPYLLPADVCERCTSMVESMARTALSACQCPGEIYRIAKEAIYANYRLNGPIDIEWKEIFYDTRLR